VRPVLVDSSAFFAHLSTGDRNHEQATAVFLRAAASRSRLVTTNAVIYETHALLLARARDGRTRPIRSATPSVS